jgi:ferredoxin
LEDILKLVYLKDIVSLKFDINKCTGCGKCTEVCPHGIFAIENRKAVINGRDQCIECGACQKNCAFGALTVTCGVGCASAMINGIMTSGDPDKGVCDCGSGSGTCC